MSTRPTMADVRAALGVPATVLPDADLQRIYDAECESQALRCKVGDDPEAEFPGPLAQSLVRRCQREVAARNLPLGMVGIDSEYGAQRLPAYDALIDELERPYRYQVVG